MTDAEIKKLVANYLEETLQRNEDARAETGNPAGLSFPNDVETHVNLLSDYREDLAEGRHLKLRNVAEYVLEGAGVTLPKDSPEFAKLCRELLKGIVEVVMPTEIERMKGNYENEYDRMGSYFSRLSPATPLAAGSTQAPVPVGGEPLSKLVQEYVEERVKGKRWRGDRTRLEAEGVFKLFLRIVGDGYSQDRDIRTLNRRDFTNFRDVLLRWPSNINKRREFRGLSVQQVLGMGATERLLSKTSINKHLAYVSTFMSWAVQNQYTESNLAEGLTVPKQRVKENAEREAYDASDILRLLHSPIYSTDLPATQPERYWLPLILLFSGMRLNEAAGLRVSDVREVDGVINERESVLCFDVNEEGNRELKTAGSQRLVPVSSVLVKLGFLEYVEKQREAGVVQLWSNLKQKGGSFGVAFSRWWGRYGRDHITTNRKKSLHSTRGRFITALRNAQVDLPLVQALVGHKSGSITEDRYHQGWSSPGFVDG